MLSSPSYAVANTGFVWLNVPAINITQWHPFEYVATTDKTSGQAAVLLHIKAYDR